MSLLQWPGGPPLPPMVSAPISLDDELERIAIANPEMFRVEYGAEWAAVTEPYLERDKVRAITGPWRGSILVDQTMGGLAHEYHAHADPSLTGANFGFVIAHLEPGDDGRTHVVFDVRRAWRPQDFPSGEIDYEVVEAEIRNYIDRFLPVELTFDAWNSAGSIQHLQAYANKGSRTRRTSVHRKTPTPDFNFNAAEIFKSLVNEGRVHAPPHELADLELLTIQRKGRKIVPASSGPCTTKDIFDSSINVAYRLAAMTDPATLLGGRKPGLSNPDWGTPSAKDQTTFDKFTSGRNTGLGHGTQRMGRRDHGNRAQGGGRW